MRWGLFLFTAAALAHDPITTKLTWSGEISRIVQARCLACHGKESSISLATYEDARPWAKAIRDEVLARRMPPWGAVKGFGDFLHDPALTQEEITRIAEWVEGGAPEGDPRYLPPMRPPAQTTSVTPSGRKTRQTAIARASRLLAIRPLADTARAKVTAIRPDGSIVPLLWLLNFQADSKRTFVYRTPISLPAGTKIVSDPATPLELILNVK